MRRLLSTCSGSGRSGLLAGIAFATTVLLCGCAPATLTYSTGKSPSAAVVADFDRDGIPDVAVTNEGDSTVTMRFGAAGGGFRRAATLRLPRGAGPTEAVAADVTGSGRLSLVVLNRGNSSIATFSSFADGAEPTSTFPMGPDSGLAGLVAAKFDPGETVDIAFTTEQPQLGSGSSCFDHGCVVMLFGSPSGLTYTGVAMSVGDSDPQGTTLYKPTGLAYGLFAPNGGSAFAVALAGTNDVVILPLDRRSGTVHLSTLLGKNATLSHPTKVFAASLRGISALTVVSSDGPTYQFLRSKSGWAPAARIGKLAGDRLFVDESRTAFFRADGKGNAEYGALGIAPGPTAIKNADLGTVTGGAISTKSGLIVGLARSKNTMVVADVKSSFWDSPPSLEFGSAALGAVVRKGVVGRVAFDASASPGNMLLALSITGPDASSFTLASADPSGRGTAPSCFLAKSPTTCTVALEFKPTTRGEKHATLVVSTPGLWKGPAKVALSGTGGTSAGPPPPVTAPTPKRWGVAEDASKFADDGGRAVYSDLATLGMSVNRWTLIWDGRNDDGSTQAAFLDRALAAKPAGVQVVLSLYPDPSAFTVNAATKLRDAPSPFFTANFCAWAGKVAARYKGRIDRFIVLNEPNLATFWPTTNRAQTITATLAACYDAIKSANGNAVVAGLGLSARAPSEASTAPVTLLQQIGVLYKSLNRIAPLFDQLAVHPYPPQDRSLSPTPAPTAPAASYAGTPTFFGVATLQRVKDAVNAGFKGTAQPIFGQGLKLVVDEYGYQVNMTGDGRYTGAEGSSTVPDQATQATNYVTAVSKYFACDADISDVLLLHLIDERDLGSGDGGGGWQSGLEEVDGKHRASFDAMAAAIKQGCRG